MLVAITQYLLYIYFIFFSIWKIFILCNTLVLHKINIGGRILIVVIETNVCLL